jgi:hypothetical protein
MDSYLLEIVAGLTLAVCLWVLKTVHVMALDLRGMKTDISYMTTKEEVADMIGDHALICAQQRAVNDQ